MPQSSTGWRRCGILLACSLILTLGQSGAATDFFALKDIKPGMRGVGKTVFSGDRIEDFQVEILGVLENIGPKESLILGRLSGGPLGSTGVMQGMSGGGRMPAAMGHRSALKPGSMISVQLVTGDLSIGADGTVTYIDGERVYAFGHRFLSVGATDLPFARSEVLTLLPSVSTS